MSKNKDKTNVMRHLDSLDIPYKAHNYENTGAISGQDVANVLGENMHRSFKTLVTESQDQDHYVFLVPVSTELDLKKAAKVVDEKKISMIKESELLDLTGYEHGGCSPLGMKRTFPTVIDSSAKNFETIYFSAGKIGYQIEMRLEDLSKVLDFKLADIKAE